MSSSSRRRNRTPPTTPPIIAPFEPEPEVAGAVFNPVAAAAVPEVCPAKVAVYTSPPPVWTLPVLRILAPADVSTPVTAAPVAVGTCTFTDCPSTAPVPVCIAIVAVAVAAVAAAVVVVALAPRVAVAVAIAVALPPNPGS